MKTLMTAMAFAFASALILSATESHAAVPADQETIILAMGQEPDREQEDQTTPGEPTPAPTEVPTDQDRGGVDPYEPDVQDYPPAPGEPPMDDTEGTVPSDAPPATDGGTY